MKFKLLLVLFFIHFPDPLDSKLIIDSFNAIANREYVHSNLTLSNEGLLTVINDVFKEMNYKIMVPREITIFKT
jgi:hypothetical protein